MYETGTEIFTLGYLELGLTFRTREPEPVLDHKTVFNPIPGLGWNENIERYLPDTSQYKAGMFRS
jgi:hypothetical protein